MLPGVEPSRDVIVDVVAAEAPLPDWLVVPGGLGWRRVVDDRATMAWLDDGGRAGAGRPRHLDRQPAPGFGGSADGLDATGHWLAIDDLERLGAHALRERVTDAGRIVTASGALPAAQVAEAFADKVSWSDVSRSLPA